VFVELTRVKQYFEKIKALESRDDDKAPRASKVDKAAAGRFIRHALVKDAKNLPRLGGGKLMQASQAGDPKAPSSSSTPLKRPGLNDR
jgi:hypothetical protein